MCANKLMWPSKLRAAALNVERSASEAANKIYIQDDRFILFYFIFFPSFLYNAESDV